jgi:penicillin-binding protein A
MSRKTFRLISLLLIPLAVFAFITADQFYKASAQLKAFPGILLESFPENKITYSPSFFSTVFFRTEIEGNNSVLGILGRHDNANYISSSRSEYINSSLPLPLLMFKAFSVSDLDACLRMSELWNGSPSGLFRSAVALEKGLCQDSRQIWETLSEKDRDSWLGQRISRQLTLAETSQNSSPVSIFDRRGIPVGHFLEGNLDLDPDLRDVYNLPKKALEKTLLQYSAPSGRGIRSSIDLNIQKAAGEALAGYRGSVVIIDAHTGELLAAVSDLRTLRTEPSAPFTQQYEPASISKLITSSAALRAGIDVDSFMEKTVCNGAKRYSGKILWCSYRSGRLGTLARALADSCNIAFADLGVAAGRRAILDELLLFGFNRPASAPFHFGKITKKTGDNRQLADLSIGLESATITPVHGALLAAAFANGGIMPEPSLLYSADGILGMSPVKVTRPPGSWVVNDPESLNIISNAMREVVNSGTARGLSLNGFPVAMKTGTGRTSGTGYVTNYIGFGPLQNRQISFCVRVTHQPTSSRVRKATRRIMSSILERLAQVENRQSASWE